MQRTTKRKWIYVRYTIPLVALLLTALLLFIPCYSYTTVDTGQNVALSLSDLFGNAWHDVCEYLFTNTGNTDAPNTAFSQTVLAMLIGFAFLFLVAFAAAIYHLVSVLRYFRDPEAVTRQRILFITLMPNRAVPLLLHLLVFPLFFFPHLLKECYISILNYYVTLQISFVDPIILAAVLYGVTLVLCVASASTETALGMNPYRKPNASNDEDEDDDDAEDD